MYLKDFCENEERQIKFFIDCLELALNNQCFILTESGDVVFPDFNVLNKIIIKNTISPLYLSKAFISPHFLIWKDRFPSVMFKDIINIEKRNQFVLPQEYKEFLLYVNGGAPEPNVFYQNIVNKKSDAIFIDYIFGVDLNLERCECSLERNMKSFHNIALPSYLICIGLGYNQIHEFAICLVVKGEYSGRVVLCNQEELKVINSQNYDYINSIERFESNFKSFVENISEHLTATQFEIVFRRGPLEGIISFLEKCHLEGEYAHQENEPCKLLGLFMMNFSDEISYPYQADVFSYFVHNHCRNAMVNFSIGSSSVLAPLMLDYGCEPTEGLLTFGINNPHYESIKRLVENGANINYQDAYGNSLLNLIRENLLILNAQPNFNENSINETIEIIEYLKFNAEGLYFK